MTMRWQVLGLGSFWVCLIPSRSAVGATRRSHRQKHSTAMPRKCTNGMHGQAMVREGAIAEPDQACNCALKISKAAKSGVVFFFAVLTSIA